MKLSAIVSGTLLVCLSQFAFAQTETVYQTVTNTSSSFYRTFISQVTGNAYTNWGDEVKLGGTARYATNIRVGTQTFKNATVDAYTPAYVRLSVWANDGANADGEFLVPKPSTLIGTVTVPGPSYPLGGVDRTSPGVQIDFPLPNVFLPEKFTFSIVNLDHNMNPDITWGVDPVTRQPLPPNPNFTQPPSFQWGAWLATGRTSSASSGVTTNVVGTSNTGPWVSFPNPGAWQWVEYQGDWGNGRVNNTAMESAITAAFTPIYGDMDGDGDLDNFDIQPFELALTNHAAYAATYKLWREDTNRRGDINQDGAFDNFDIQPFEQLLTAGAQAFAVAVPEPQTAGMLLVGLVALAGYARRRCRS